MRAQIQKPVHHLTNAFGVLGAMGLVVSAEVFVGSVTASTGDAIILASTSLGAVLGAIVHNVARYKQAKQAADPLAGADQNE